jgi:TatD DNase family protein
VYPALGIHPSEITNEYSTISLDFIEKNAHKCVSIGEIGLDYWYKEARKNKGVREKQRQIFVEQLIIAKENEKPVSIHSRGSWQDALNITKKNGSENAIFHWYSGPIDVLREILDLGYYISATPAAEYSKHHRLSLENAPIEKIVIETDAPVFNRKLQRTSEPKDLSITLKALSELKDLPTKEVAEETTKNAKKIFKI